MLLVISQQKIADEMKAIIAKVEGDNARTGNSAIVALQRFVQLQKAVEDGVHNLPVSPCTAELIEKDVAAHKLPTLTDVDRMALDTLRLEGEITITEDTPPDPSVGDPGSDEITGKITGRFEIPASVVKFNADGLAEIVTDDWNPGGTVHDYIREGVLFDEIEKAILDKRPTKYDVIRMRGQDPDIILTITGVTKKGDKAVVEFTVEPKEL